MESMTRECPCIGVVAIDIKGSLTTRPSNAMGLVVGELCVGLRSAGGYYSVGRTFPIETA